MRSYEEQRQQKISQESSRQREAVKPSGYAGAPSSSSAQIAPSLSKTKTTCWSECSKERTFGKLTSEWCKTEEPRSGLCNGSGATSLPENALGNGESRTPRGNVQTLASQTGGNSQTRRRRVRLLGIPTVMDRFLQQALLQVMNPIFDAHFSWYSYGFRQGKRAHDAVKQAQRFIQSGLRWIVDMDLAKFFDRVNHDMLMVRVAKKVTDKRVLKLI